MKANALMSNILVIRYGTIGDTIFASAFYRELRNSLPEAKIDILADDIAYQVMKNCPYINDIHRINGKYRNIFKYIKLFKNYDTVYFLKNDNFFTKTAFLSGVKNRIGFDVKRNKFLTLKSPYNEDRHEIDCYLDLLRLSNFEIKSDKTEIWTDKNTDKVNKITENTSGKKILIQAYSRFSQKNWINEYWAEVIKYLINECDASVFFAGGEKDTAKYEDLIKLINPYVKKEPINVCAKLTIQESFALIKDMDFVIGIDSGLIHTASAFEKPSILLHGPTSLKRWHPRNKNCTVISKYFDCSPCCLQSKSIKYCKRKTSKCMLALTPDIVISELKKHFSNKSGKNIT